jgi:hypothetical protein
VAWIPVFPLHRFLVLQADWIYCLVHDVHFLIILFPVLLDVPSNIMFAPTCCLIFYLRCKMHCHETALLLLASCATLDGSLVVQCAFSAFYFSTY